MNTTRRQFLASLGGAALAPLAIATAIKGGSTPQPRLMLPDGGPRPYKGPAIKVPSNRWHRCVDSVYVEGQSVRTVVEYCGHWDGTFKLEEGCTNPAYVLADLYERTGEEPDWVVAAKVPVPPGAPMVMDGMSQLLKPRLNWRMLYDWGQWADEPADGPIPPGAKITRSFRMAASTEYCRTHADLVALRETLRMYCLLWQSIDPRYRRSYPVYS